MVVLVQKQTKPSCLEEDSKLLVDRAKEKLNVMLNNTVNSNWE